MEGDVSLADELTTGPGFTGVQNGLLFVGQGRVTLAWDAFNREMRRRWRHATQPG
jgi:hypothetical protein